MFPDKEVISTKQELLQLCSQYNPRIVVLAVLMSLNWGLSGSFFVIPAYISAPAKVDLENFTTITEEFGLDNNTLWGRFDIFASVFSLGNLLLLVVFGRIADRIGRRPVIIFGIFGMGLTGLLCAVSNTHSFLILFRFIQGTLYYPSTMPNWVMIAESSTPTSHAAWGFIFGLAWCVGASLVAPIVAISSSWRICLILLSLPNIILASFLTIYLPESLEFSLLHGQKGHLQTFLNRMVPGKDVDVDALLIETSMSESRKVNKTTSKLLSHEGVIFLLTTGCYFSFLYTLIHNALSLGSTSIQVGDVHLNFILASLVELPSYAAIPLLFTLIGDISTLCVFHSLTVFSSFSLLLIDSETLWYTVFWMTVKFASSSAFMCALVVLSYRYPAEHRSLCVSIAATFANIAAVVAPEMYLLDSLMQGATFLLYGIGAVAATVLTVCITKKIQ